MFLAQNKHEALLVVSHMYEGDFFCKQKTLFCKCLFPGKIPGQFLKHSHVWINSTILFYHWSLKFSIKLSCFQWIFKITRSFTKISGNKKAFSLEESFHCPWEQGKKRGYHLTGPVIWLHFVWVWQRKKCLVTVPQLTNVFSLHSTLQDFLKSVQTPSKLFCCFWTTKYWMRKTFTAFSVNEK